MSQVYLWWLRASLLVSLLALAACGSGGSPRDGLPPDDDLPLAPGDGAEDFLSHVAGHAFGGGADAGAGAPNAGGEDADDGGDAERAIAEADILQVVGDRLYALSRYAGLHVIDVKDPKHMRVLGRYRVNAEPFEMYLRDGVVYVMFNSYGRYEYDEAIDSTVWRSTSRMEALDVREPAAIKVLGSYDVPGAISDSRMVGDVIYLVTYENGWCWGCETLANTRVASFRVAQGAKFEQVDELRFSDANAQSWGPRSVSVSQERMYIAGPHWDDRDGTIQVVDIADPTGKLSLGAEITVHGSIESRWQMDEYDGVLRVISQPVPWRSNDPPHVQTFEIVSSSEVKPLADLPMKLPRPEDLRSVRFDGPRAYAITFEQIDPLFTFDLSDPRNPKQVGELEIPGFVHHMEPRGDLVYALGFDWGTQGQGALHVSIFDVSNLAAPKMTSRVNFGGDWGHFAEDQDRIHKAFTLLLDQNLILVPFGGGSYDEAQCHYKYQSGIQLIDVHGAELTLRGVAPQIGQARRALVHRDHLLGITDNAVQTFDISNRDAPAQVGKLEVARNVSQVRVMGDKLLRFGQDWWTDRAVLDFTELSRADAAEPLGELSLSNVDGASRVCDRWAYFQGQVLVHGDYAYVPRRVDSWDANAPWPYNHRAELILYVIDLRDRAAPRVIGTFSTEATGDEWLGGLVLTDSALLIGRSKGSYYYDPSSGQRGEPKYAYEVYDLADPRAPVLASVFEVPSQVAAGGWGYAPYGCGVDMPWGYWYGGGTSALVDGDLVVSQHEQSVDDGSGRVRYYLDRLDVSDPSAPRLLPPINIPGQVVHFDAAAARAVTVDYVVRESRQQSWDACYGQSQLAWFDERTRRCRIYQRQVNVLEIQGERARRISQVLLDADRVSTSLAVSKERVFYVTMEPGGYREGHGNARLDALAFAQTGQLQRLPSVALNTGAWWSKLSARGTRAFITGAGSLYALQTKDKSAPKLERFDLAGWSCAALEVHGDRAYCAMGMSGVAAFDLQ
jgi:hypothetical protein